MAEVLAEAGYETAAFVDGGLMAAGFGLEQGFGLYDDVGGGIEKIWPKVSSWIEGVLGMSAGKEDPSPFFLLIHCYDVHSPYEISPWRFRDTFVPDLRELPPESFTKRMSEVMADTWNRRNENPPPQLGPAKLQYAIAMYDGGIRHVDARFGSLVSLLDRTGLLDQSIVIIISDHGDTFQEHQSLFHEQIYSPVTHIPMIVRFPGGRFAGRYDPVVESIDLMPTVLDFVGAPIPSACQGETLLPLLESGEWTPRIAFTESPYRGRRLGAASESFRLLVTGKTGAAELFDYRNDPLELSNVLPGYPEQERLLRKALEQWEIAVAATRKESEKVDSLDARTRQQLKTLGYLN